MSETTFAPDPSWRPFVHVRRGGWFRPEAEPAADAVAWWQAVPAGDDLATAALRHPESDPELVGAARAGGEDVLGAAVLAVLLHRGLARKTGGPHETWRIADAWWARGPGFAVRAAATMAQVVHIDRYDQGTSVLKRRQSVHQRYFSPGEHPLFRRLRTLLAAAGDADYEAATAALAPCRADLSGKVVASYLVPTREDWADELAAAVRPVDDFHYFDWPSVLQALSTRDQLEAVPTTVLRWRLQDKEVRYTLLEAMGPASATTFARVADADPNGGDSRKLLLSALAGLPGDEAFELLVKRLGQKHVQPLLTAAMARTPERAVRLLARGATAQAGYAEEAGFLLRCHVAAHPDVAAGVLPALEGEDHALVERALAGEERLPVVAGEALPRVLVDPPWASERPAREPIVLNGLTVPAEPELVWAPGEQRDWAEWHTRLRAGLYGGWQRAAETYDAGKLSGSAVATLFVQAPDDWVRARLASWRPDEASQGQIWGRVLASRHGLLAHRPLVAMAAANPGHRGEVLLPYVSPEVALLMADWLVRLKKARPVALAWFGQHPAAGTKFLVPPALGPAGPARSTAEAALRVLAKSGHEQAVSEAAAHHGAEAAEAVAELLAADPLDVLPARLPVPGAWADPAVLPQIRVRDGEQALPGQAIPHVLTVLALSKPGEVYPGLAHIREFCDPGSLAGFAWAVFRRWRAADYPVKDGWVLTALAELGDDDVVRGLSPLIRAWPGEGGHARAAAALDVLAGIGTDLALLHLNSIAQKVKFKALKLKAQEKIAAVAEGLGLSADQLADRLVPTLGLDEAATAVIDYGPRRFVVGFDEQLKPYVTDTDGKPRKALPKPGAKDGADLAAAEYKRFAALKKDVRTVAAEQISRLESAMVLSRRWPAAEFEQLLAGHPLLIHLVRRLVWRTTAGETFRCAEDRTYADVHDEEYALPRTAEVGIAHPIELADELTAWSDVFADYEILQPFPQLGRPAARLEEAERSATTLKRFENRTVPVGKLLGLTQRTWVRGAVLDNGVEGWILRPLPAGGAVVVNLDPGITVGNPADDPAQELTDIWLDETATGAWAPRGERVFGNLDPVTASELLGELTELTG
ncbi:DUF4132 domain-containing protein [Amycolatopsis sp. A133]|uniref:DUF4132 domain-containing protein n=1 Tax=Amycolatopsis sp. A133 TaxID=3064472 RepID=UPI0027E9B647|nr:DUF4132 domain-containing protein [Amycolatopsis sp. A133]MDQ7808875.1 DUF4132 domain-containing protein [Amycolatopsis sp. A133]